MPPIDLDEAIEIELPWKDEGHDLIGKMLRKCCWGIKTRILGYGSACGVSGLMVLIQSGVAMDNLYSHLARVSRHPAEFLPLPY